MAGPDSQPPGDIHHADLSVRSGTSGRWERRPDAPFQNIPAAAKPGEPAVNPQDTQPSVQPEKESDNLMDRAKEALEKATAKGGPLYYDETDPDMDRTIQAMATARALQEVKKKPAETDAQYQVRVNTAAEEAKKAVGEKKAGEDDTTYQARVDKAVAEAKVQVSPQVPAETDGAYQARLGKRTVELIDEERILRKDCRDLVRSGELERADNGGLVSQDANGKPIDPPRNINSTLHKGLEQANPDLAKEFDQARRIQVGDRKYTKDEYVDIMAPTLLPFLQKKEPGLTEDELKRRLADDFDKNATLEPTADTTPKTATNQASDKHGEKQLSPEEEELKTLNGFINEAMNYVQMELDNPDWNRAEAARQIFLQCDMARYATAEAGNIPLKCIYMREALMSFQEYVENNTTEGQTPDTQYGHYSMLKKFLETPGAAHVNMDDLKKYYQSQLQIYGIPWVEEFNTLVEAGHFSRAMTAIYCASLIDDEKGQRNYLRAVLRFKDAKGDDIDNKTLIENLLSHGKTIPTFVDTTFSGDIKEDKFKQQLQRLLPLFIKQTDKKGLLPFIKTIFGSSKEMLALAILQHIDGTLDPERVGAQFEQAMQQPQR